MTPSILWFRQDLRLADNPSLHAALESGPVLPVYVLDDAAAEEWAPGGAQRWWLHHSLAALAADLAARGAPLLLLRGDAATLLPHLAGTIGAGSVHAGRMYEPWARRRDEAVHHALAETGRKLTLHSATLLHEPHRLRTGQGKPYSVFTPFSRAVFALGEPAPPLPVPDRIASVASPLDPLALEGLDLLPRPPIPEWWSEFPDHWQPGEAGAARRLARLTPELLAAYPARRDIPGEDATSALSPHLRFGEVSPRQVWHAAREAGAAGEHTFLKEVLWRDFSYHLLWHRPEMPQTALQSKFGEFPWRPDSRLLAAWQQGRTGYPIVDAGMRQLWRTGWMHNRVRMVAASLLVKHLLQPWQHGEAWFWDTLVDGDLASNAASWQWVAGCGADAAPYFRVFNPVLQGEKFDPEGSYVRRWVPELAGVPGRFIHKPWEAPRPPAGYPAPIVEHGRGRERALAAYAALRDEG
ncbi:deoxyribodipyrimidine photo-lyase [Rhodovarius crocodyli]|uniref:Deoxyribodipyrimidine photo-lyase n=1 Tax=Rhodovarius crocodyli TaxID=1979269 RepID=A0A437MJ84_9PROT|nr:deoxyribodipyrimidine photo-lyase [Rhodovarius crocodyli]RVT97710.1 deoxyribodipyrimidine photo-lyase [Rhodovarius crocodyli]